MAFALRYAWSLHELRTSLRSSTPGTPLVLAAISSQLATLQLYDRVPPTTSSLRVREPRIVALARAFEELRMPAYQAETTSSEWHSFLSQTIGNLTVAEIQLSVSVVALLTLLDLASLLRPTPRGENKPASAINGRIQNLRAHYGSGPLMGELFSLHFPAEALLSKDPSGCYSLSDGDTQMTVRYAIEHHATVSRVSMVTVAQTALELSQRFLFHQPAEYISCNVAFYLVDDGQEELQKCLCSQSGMPGAPFRPQVLNVQKYVALFSFCSVFVSLLLSVAFYFHTRAIQTSVTLGVVILIISSESANRLLDNLLGFMVRARPMLRVRSDHTFHVSVIVAVPTLISSRASAISLIHTAEQLGCNAPPSCRGIVLLTDLVDSSQQEPTEEEVEWLSLCCREVSRLNVQQMSRRQHWNYHILHRSRSYSVSEERWMGFDRKRGKLVALNELALGRGNSFSLSYPSADNLVGATHVFVIDDNSRCSGVTMDRLMAAAAHPLNKPVRTSGRVVRGYGMLQPFPAVSSRSMDNWGWMKHLLEAELDESRLPEYIRNINYDCFGVIGFYGKGLYEVASWQDLANTVLVPETILSHDILEGGYVRTGYEGTAIIVEDGPATLKALYLRMERWSRGDLHNLRFILNREDPQADRSQSWRLTHYLVFRFLRRACLPLSRVMFCVIIAADRSEMMSALAAMYVVFALGPDLVRSSAAMGLRVYGGRLSAVREECVEIVNAIEKGDGSAADCPADEPDSQSRIHAGSASRDYRTG